MVRLSNFCSVLFFENSIKTYRIWVRVTQFFIEYNLGFRQLFSNWYLINNLFCAPPFSMNLQCTFAQFLPQTQTIEPRPWCWSELHRMFTSIVSLEKHVHSMPAFAACKTPLEVKTPLFRWVQHGPGLFNVVYKFKFRVHYYITGGFLCLRL